MMASDNDKLKHNDLSSSDCKRSSKKKSSDKKSSHHHSKVKKSKKKDKHSSRKHSHHRDDDKKYDRNRSRHYNNSNSSQLADIVKLNLESFLKMKNNFQTDKFEPPNVVIKTEDSEKTSSIRDLVDYCKKLSSKENEQITANQQQKVYLNGSDKTKSSSLTSNDKSTFKSSSFSQLAIAYQPDPSYIKTINDVKSDIAKSVSKLYPVSTGRKHQKIEMETKDAIDLNPFLTNKTDVATSETMTPPIIEDPVFKRYNDKSNASPIETETTEIPKSSPNEILGKFTGSIEPGLKLLKPEELEGQFKAWTKKDLLSNAAPITDGIGKKLLEKMGWKVGQGLGKHKEGSIEPLKLEIKNNRKGLVSQDEKCKVIREPQAIKNPAATEGKHPVSSLMELCKLKHWNEPLFEIVEESGPSHLKNFLMRVILNSVSYQPDYPSPNKKLAKANAAMACLQALGYSS